MAKKNLMERFYPESKFGGFTDSDGTISFFTRINALIKPDDEVLDVGCGRGEYARDSNELRRNLRSLKGKCRKVIGIDVDPIAESNVCVDEFRLIRDDSWPVSDSSIDLCFADFVIEHVTNPELFFAEAFRVLKDDGYLCLRTSNVLGYVGIGAKLIPKRYSSKLVGKMQDEREEDDIFPTCYRCNTVWSLRRQLKRHGFVGCAYGFESEPRHLNFSSILYFFGTLYQKFIPRSLKTGIFVFARKVG